VNRIDIASVEKHLQKLKKLNRWKKIVAIGCCIVLVVTISPNGNFEFISTSGFMIIQ
jgi:hypothetical protein